MYISEVSGHHSASVAIEKAVKTLNPDVDTLNINCFSYTTPIWEKVVNKTYMGMLKTKPQIWDYLYDNPKIMKRTLRLRKLIYKANIGKLKAIFDDFNPDIVVCTQAYPCGMVADYKRVYGLNIPLIGILTDFTHHSYWVFDNVDAYIVPTKETFNGLIRYGVVSSKIKIYGIPIDPIFREKGDRKALLSKFGLVFTKPTVLIMGGGQGLGPIKEILLELEETDLDIQIAIVTGTNKRLFNWLKDKEKNGFKKKTIYFGHIDFVDNLMEIATIIITKPGGVTTAEALAKGLPIIIINPLPGQEMRNTRFLLREGIAIRAKSPKDVTSGLVRILNNPEKLRKMKTSAKRHSRADSAIKIAEYILSF